jgi:hypothetical protein
MAGPDPFRSELDAAHRRIETLEVDHAARVRDLESENARLRQRLVDIAPSRTATGRTFGALAMIILGVSLAAGIFFARVTRAPVSIPFTPLEIAPVELPMVQNGDPANPDDFDRADVAFALDNVKVDDCVQAGATHGGGHVRLTLAPSGLVTSAAIDQGAYGGTQTGRCIEDRYRAAHVPMFSGAPRVVGKSFFIR